MFFGAGKAKVVNDALGALRVKIGHEKGYASGRLEGAVGGRLSEFEYDEEAKRWNAMHHPFNRAQGRHEDKLATDRVRARQGLRHGAERLGDRRRLGAYPPREVQSKVFRALSIGAEEAQQKFGFLPRGAAVRSAAARGIASAWTASSP